MKKENTKKPRTEYFIRFTQTLKSEGTDKITNSWPVTKNLTEPAYDDIFRNICPNGIKNLFMGKKLALLVFDKILKEGKKTPMLFSADPYLVVKRDSVEIYHRLTGLPVPRLRAYTAPKKERLSQRS